MDLSVPHEQYVLTSQRLIIKQKGLLSSKKEEIELFKIRDVVIKQSVTDKIRSVGDIKIMSTDASTPKFIINNVKNPNEIADTIMSAVRKAKKQMNIVYRQDI